MKDETIDDIERRDLILATIGQLAKFNDMRVENQEAFDERGGPNCVIASFVLLSAQIT
jgi:hypothetical protein